METRHPAVAGMFYYGDADNLKKQLDKLFSDSRPGNYLCVVSPHAGYEYSGRTAALAIGSLKPGKRFIILGPNHTGMGSEFSVMSRGKWRTPLGDCEIDSKLAKELKSCNLLEDDDFAHEREHSIEVQLPFLQHRLKRFEFVPITIMGMGYSDEFLKRCEILGKAIAKAMKADPDIRVIASSDFSHYIPAETAKEKDEKAMERIRKLNPTGFFETLRETDASVCGYAPIAVLLFAARELGLKKVDMIDYTTSGEKTGDMRSVVTYSAIGFGKNRAKH
jgi:AmmeMemoRadiSam system protein B